MKTSKPFTIEGRLYNSGLEIGYEDGMLMLAGHPLMSVSSTSTDAHQDIMHDTLLPQYFDNADADDASNARLKPDLRDRLLKIANDFYAGTGFKARIKDIILTGSAANYNWHAQSDLDVHVVIDYAEENADTELVSNAAYAMKWQWNEQHDIVIDGHSVEMYIQNAAEPHTASGVYSILNDAWIVVPKQRQITVNADAINAKASALRSQFKALQERFDDGEVSEELLKAVQDCRYRMLRLRRDDFEAGGDEFSTGNLAFKQLRNDGTIGDAIKLEQSLYDKLA